MRSVRQPMKILHVVPSFAPAWRYGGPINTVLQLCRQMARSGCEVRVLTTDANGPDAVLDIPTSREIETADGLRVRYCARLMPESVSMRLLRELPRYLRWADVVHLTAVYSFPTIPTLLACKLMDKPVVWSPRGSLQRWEGTRRSLLKTMWERICRAVAPRRLRLHVTSEEENRESTSRLPGIQTVIIPNGVEIPDESRHTERKEALRLLYIGRINPKKGIENLLAAFKLLNGHGPQYKLTIAGTGDGPYEASIRGEIARLALSHQAKMIGQVIGDAKHEAFENADVVVVPSHVENFCMVIAEALAHGVPVIASKGTPWAGVESVGCGLWVDNDPPSLADAIERINHMPLDDMGQRGRRWMVQQFSWETIAAKMLECYASLLPQREAPA
ncbi:MAG: glycosyltransferase [Candidatus Binataceae bacterium]